MPEKPASLILHGTPVLSHANGPGMRFVFWFQGCTLNCLGCFNPESHDPSAGHTWSIEDMLAEISTHVGQIEGITFSGGEPFQQPAGLLALISALRRHHDDLSIIIFSGYRLPEINAQVHGREILAMVDVLIAGRYVPKCRVAQALLGSANQQYHYLSGRYKSQDFADQMDAELVIDGDGHITITGIDPPLMPKSSTVRSADI